MSGRRKLQHRGRHTRSSAWRHTVEQRCKRRCPRGAVGAGGGHAAGHVRALRGPRTWDILHPAYYSRPLQRAAGRRTRAGSGPRPDGHTAWTQSVRMLRTDADSSAPADVWSPSRRATYRLQLHADFGFDRAGPIADYLARLGPRTSPTRRRRRRSSAPGWTGGSSASPATPTCWRGTGT
jgi:hypothetical protein